MTALRDEQPSRPARHTLVIDPALIQGGKESTACYGDPAWSLFPLSDNPSANASTIHWDVFLEEFAEDARLIAWFLINEPVPALILREQSIAFRARLSPEQIYRTVMTWARFSRWLVGRGRTGFAGTCEQDYRDYMSHRVELGRARATCIQDMTALTRLWIFDSVAGGAVGISEPPWQWEGADDFLPAASSRGENETDPISPATMGPLLVWALRMVEDFAPDILAAWRLTQGMTAAAAANTSTPESLDALKSYLTGLMDRGEPVPVIFRRSGSQEAVAAYISALTGASTAQVNKLSRRPAWRERLIASERRGCPLPMKITATLDGRPWTLAIDFTEASLLTRHLATAAFIVISYLTGMRPGEVLALRAGCCPDPESGHHLINGRVYKTARDEDGNHLSSGQDRPVPWMAIPPVVAAIRVLEQIVGEGLLFSASAHDFIAARTLLGALTAPTMRDRVEQFISWASNFATSLDRSHETIPADPHGAIGTARFRRTLAWHIARRPGGLVALAIQYGHMRTSVSGNYASRGRDGIHELLDVETARATADTLTDLNDTLAAGGGISGPAARRAINAAATAPTYTGAIVTARQARQLLGNPSLAVYDNPHALLLCVHDPAKALCSREGQQDTPSLDRCVTGCANISRTDQHANHLRERADVLDKQAAALPLPLADRKRARAARLRGLADQHDRDRMIPQQEISV